MRLWVVIKTKTSVKVFLAKKLTTHLIKLMLNDLKKVSVIFITNIIGGLKKDDKLQNSFI